MFGPVLRVENFFDRSKVIAAIEKGKLKAFSRAGALQRGIMRRQFAKRKNRSTHSTPPTPPYNHVGSRDFGLKKVLFAYDKRNNTVVVGPVRLEKGINAVPGLLDRGGTATIYIPDSQVKWAGHRKPILLPSRNRKRVVARYRPRPFVKPSLEQFKDKYPEVFRGVVDG